ncbi:uncharacterized protein LOC114531722 isoform X2 [Dendronephthya gigantea]|uniref:uncharacterized protein LOC114531722 isoform X2 n=1 Tax=Dendronephthya gigantea TaxID=151771 RepID=UPI00106A625B|nr:uncharacterized protein LOC114531722 isoform X2 [Dendronephthya gigantea]
MAFRGQRCSKSITVQKEGYLHIKKNVSVLKPKEKSWQQKYVVLRKSYGDGICLEWYESYEAFISHKNTTKRKLDGIDYIGPVDMGKDYTYAFILFGGGQSQLQMAAKNENERCEWVKALNQCLQNGKKSNPTAPPSTHESSSSKNVFPVKLKDYMCCAGQDNFKNLSHDFTMIVGPEVIALITVDTRGEQKIVASWLLENIKSYESRPLEQNPSQKLLSIDTGRRSSTGQGTFNFYTPYGDQIKNLISQNTKRTYLRKMSSQDSFHVENDLYSSSPESSRGYFSPNQRSHSAPVPNTRRPTFPSREGSIPFHKYDPPTNYAHYIEQKDGYVDIFTDPRKVEENRMRLNSRSSLSSARSPKSNDTPFGLYDPSESHEGYISVLPDSESASGYIDVLPDTIPEHNDHTYLDVLNEEESSQHYIDVIGDGDLGATGTNVSGDPSYIEVLPDDESTSKSTNRSISRGDSDEIYIDVDENRKKFELREQHFESHDQGLVTREQQLDSREENGDTRHESSKENVSQTHDSPQPEVHVTCHNDSRDVCHELRQTRESTASVNSPSPRWPQSVTSQTSTDYSSLSSECDVFQERENGIVVEVFTEESTKSDGLPTNPDAIPSTVVVASGNSDTLPSNEVSPKSDDDSLMSKDYLALNPPVPPAKSALVASKSATLPTKTEGLPTDSDVNESRTRARSWHSDEANNLVDNSGDSSSTSESEHMRDFSDDDTSDHSEVSPKNLSSSEKRDRSHTEGDLILNPNLAGMDPALLRAFQQSLTNPQALTPTSNRHPPLTREIPYNQDQIIFQLENPIQGVSQLPRSEKKNSSAVEVKYICSNCGWHKRSKKRSSLRPSLRSKVCPQCNNPVTKQDAKSPKSKEKMGLFDIIRGKRRSLEGKIDKKDLNFIKPERPSTTPEPSFLKSFRTTASELGLHSPKMDPKRSGLGIAPSPLRAIAAVSIEGEERSYDDGISGKNPLATSLSDSGLSEGVASQNRTVSLTSTKTPSAQECNPLERSKSSPPLICGNETGQDTLTADAQDCEKVPRKNSGLTLPTLPEVEDQASSDQPSCHTPGTPPPMIPPRTRAPPIPPRQRNSPLGIPTEENLHKLRRSQTDPAFSQMVSSRQPKAKYRVSRTMTDPGNDSSGSSENIRNAVSLEDLQEDCNEELAMRKIVSLSLGDGLDNDAPPPPLPPRRTSVQPQTSPKRASNENERLFGSPDSPRVEPRQSSEINIRYGYKVSKYEIFLKDRKKTSI